MWMAHNSSKNEARTVLTKETRKRFSSAGECFTTSHMSHRGTFVIVPVYTKKKTA